MDADEVRIEIKIYKLDADMNEYESFRLLNEDNIFLRNFRKEMSKKIMNTVWYGVITILDNKKNIIKIYTDIYGETYGTRLGKYVYKLGKLNENGLATKDIKKYEKLMNEFQELLNEAGGMQKFFEEKNNSNEDMAERFERYGIDRAWYSFEEDSSKMVWCKIRKNGNKSVCWQLSGYCSKGSRVCTEDEVFDYMLDKLMLYKKQYEFEQGVRVWYLKYVEIQSDEIGFYGGYDRGKCGFYQRSIKGDKDEELISKGYSYSGYDHYMGDFLYYKTVGVSFFSKLNILIVTRDSQNKIEEKSIVIDISEETRDDVMELRRDIIDWIRENDQLNIMNNNLYEKIEHYLKREVYATPKDTTSK